MAVNNQHSPMPWHVAGVSATNRDIRDANNHTIATDLDKADAEHIVNLITEIADMRDDCIAAHEMIEFQRDQIGILADLVQRTYNYARHYNSPTFGPLTLAEMEAALALTFSGNSAAEASPPATAANCIKTDAEWRADDEKWRDYQEEVQQHG